MKETLKIKKIDFSRVSARVSSESVETLHGREAYAKRYPYAERYPLGLGNPLGQRLYKSQKFFIVRVSRFSNGCCIYAHVY